MDPVGHIPTLNDVRAFSVALGLQTAYQFIDNFIGHVPKVVQVLEHLPAEVHLRVRVLLDLVPYLLHYMREVPLHVLQVVAVQIRAVCVVAGDQSGSTFELSEEGDFPEEAAFLKHLIDFTAIASLFAAGVVVEQHLDLALVHEVHVVSLFALPGDDVGGEEEHGLEVGDEEALLHGGTLGEDGHFLDQGAVQVVQNLLPQGVVEQLEEEVEVLVQVREVLNMKEETSNLILDA